jgi:UDP-3-O-[3-hydroxymyristoyl] glucosamine N-acyltransferase
MGNNLLQRLLQKIAWTAPGGDSLRPQLHRWRGVHVGQNVWISQYVYIDDLHPEAIWIGDNCTIGLRTTIYAHLYRGGKQEHPTGQVVIEKNVFIGPHCVLLPNIRIGEGAVIKAGTVVSRNVPAHTFWGDNSAGPLARVTVPLIDENGYDNFVRGLRPIRRPTAIKKQTEKSQPAPTDSHQSGEINETGSAHQAHNG